MANKKQPAEKHKVYVVSCPETDLGNVYVQGYEGVGDLIEGDIESAQDVEKFNYTISVKWMTQRQINNLPEYEG